MRARSSAVIARSATISASTALTWFIRSSIDDCP